jgi:hypothetical protein
MKPTKPIVVDVPMSEARRDRVEREVFARLDAMRDVDHANHIAPVRGRRLPVYAAGVAAVAAAASVVFVLSRDPAPAPAAPPSSPSLVVTPEGGSSRFTVGDAVIDAGSDTSVEVKHEANGTTTLLLARGSVDCDVLPRPDRAPFRVVAGDVTVEVVGTRFEVSREDDVTRVDVARGKVKVHGNGEQRFVGAGQSWTSALAGSAVTAVVTPPIAPDTTPPVVTEEQPAADVEIELPAERMRPAKPSVAAPPTIPTPSPGQAYRAALKIEDDTKRGEAYRAVANGNHTWAALSLLNLAELQAKFDVDAALATLDELKRRFPKAENAEEGAWFRVDVLRDARRMDDARKAAASYLRDFPQGTYAKLAARLVRPSSP